MDAMSSEEYLFLLAAPFLRHQHSKPTTEMERFVAFVLSRFSTLVIVSALAWLCWRAYQVLSKPSDELISLLGLEVPVPPALSLAGIRADGVILNWKAPELQKTSTVKHYIHLNGVSVGELSPQETSIAVTGLRPDTNYIIRVVAVNPLNFEAKSEAIRVQTKPASSRDLFQTSADHEATPDNEPTNIPTIQPYKVLGESNPSLPTPPPMNREHSGSISQQRRGLGARRVSPATALGSHLDNANDSDEYEGSLSDLTGTLERLRAEIEASEQDLAKEEEEFESTQSSLNTQKNDLKQAVSDKESASKALKKQAADLASQNSAAQSRRIAAEKQLQQKHQERQKLRDEIDKWDSEILAIHAEAERLDIEKVTYREDADKEIARLREEHADQAVTNKALEEVLRQTRTKIKELENEKDLLDQEEPEVVHGPGPFSHSEEMEWTQKLQILQFNYHSAFQKLEQVREYAQQTQLTLEAWKQRRLSQPHMFNTTPTLEFVPPGRRHSQRRSRGLSLRNNELNQQNVGFDLTSGPSYNASINSISPAFSSISPFFNMANGAALPPEHMAAMSHGDIDQLTGGAPTSPSVAGALLPRGLLENEMEPTRLGDFEPGSSRSSPINPNVLPGLGAAQTLERQNQGPSSPISNQSRSPSVFASPRESTTHLPFHHASDSFMESDKRSVRSTTSSMRGGSGTANTTTRFASLFGFNRQRGKTFSDEGPSLGSLRTSESQSFPRQDATDPPPIGTRRRGSHSGGTWMGQLQNPFSRNSDPAVASTINPAAPRKRFIMFSSKTDPWYSTGSSDQPPSPRPASNASSETNNVLPKPSADTQTRFGWPVSAGESLGQRYSPLGADWGLAATSSFSRHPSRRPSAQYGPGHSFMDAAFLEGADPDLAPQRRSPKLAPIGTRPASQVSTGSAEKPKLNPAAPSFKTLFTRDKKTEKAEKGKSKKDDKREGLTAEPSSPEPRSPAFKDLSPPDGRKSKEAPSISTTGDTASEPRESLERSISRTPSEANPGANGQRETFMQKLSRKSSASMFNFPGFGNKEKSGRFSGKKGTSQATEYGTPDETDEESAAGGKTSEMSKSFESEKPGASPMLSGRESKEKDRSGFSFRSLTGRRRGDKTPSLHESVASETGDEDELGIGGETWTAVKRIEDV